MRSLVPLVSLVALAACVPQQTGVPIIPAESGVPLRQLPAEAALPEVRSDLLASASAAYGAATLQQAMRAPTVLIVKRFVGMIPPPPPGSDPDWRPPTPTALVIRDSNGWKVAGKEGWRAMNGQAAARVEAIIDSNRFWGEATTVQACPDYGASNLYLKVPGRTETVRNAMCTSVASDLVGAALDG